MKGDSRQRFAQSQGSSSPLFFALEATSTTPMSLFFSSPQKDVTPDTVATTPDTAVATTPFTPSALIIAMSEEEYIDNTPQGCDRVLFHETDESIVRSPRRKMRTRRSKTRKLETDVKKRRYRGRSSPLLIERGNPIWSSSSSDAESPIRSPSLQDDTILKPLIRLAYTKGVLWLLLFLGISSITIISVWSQSQVWHASHEHVLLFPKANTLRGWTRRPVKKSKHSTTAGPTKSSVMDTINKPVDELLSEVTIVPISKWTELQQPTRPTLTLTRPRRQFSRKDRHLYRANSEASQSPPRVFVADESVLALNTKHRFIHLNSPDYTDATQLYGLLDSSDVRLAKMEPREEYVQGECVPMQDWQTTYHPHCNGVHELGFDHLVPSILGSSELELFGTKGFWRNAWKVKTQNGQANEDNWDTIVLKTLKIQHNFEAAHFEHDRIDAVAMERLTSSPHVIDIFGFCGHSVLSEYADGLRLGTLADRAKDIPLERLKIARDIADGLADVHGIDGDDNTTFVHLDINPANVVSVGGRLKLNDFNIGIIRQWNTTSNTPCGFPAQYPNAQWRSPEEARNQHDLTEKVDVFSLGHIFFRLVCGHEPWNHLEPNGKPDKATLLAKVQQGILPTIPADIMESTDPEVVAIRNAMLQCYTHDPTMRPSARRIAKDLNYALKKLDKPAVKVR